MGILLQDLKYGLRMLARNPGFTAVAVLTLALGIGANTAIFSVFKALVFDPFPYPDANRIVQVWSTDLEEQWKQPFSSPDFLDLREQNSSFDSVGAYREGWITLGGKDPVSIRGAACTVDVLRTFGVPPAHGRWFSEAEMRTGADHVVVISHSLWERRFASDPNAVGETIRLKGQEHTIIGVMPRNFEFASPRFDGHEFELWVPLVLIHDESQRGSHWLTVIGRLKKGATFEATTADIKTIAVRLAQAHPLTNKRTTFWVNPIAAEVTGSNLRRLSLLMGAAGLVLLVACANVAGMLLAKGTSRQPEFAVRAALGASRGDIIRLVLVESFLLAALGAAAGVGLASWSTSLLQTVFPAPLARQEAISVNHGMLFFTAALSFFAALVFGLPPALAAARTTLLETLKGGGLTHSGARARNRFMRNLVVAQIGVALVLVNIALLLTISYRNVLRLADDVASDSVLTAELWLLGDRYEDRTARVAFWDRFLERVKSLPGVSDAAVITKLPLEGGTNSGILTEGENFDPQINRPLVEDSYTTPKYFAAMGIPLLQGRTLSDADFRPETLGVVVNRALAEHYWPGQSPLGCILRDNNANPDWTASVVGLVENVRQWGAEMEPQPEIYFPYALNPRSRSFLILRSAADPRQLVPTLRRELAGLDSGLAFTSVRTMDEVASRSSRGRRFLALLINVFMGTALLMAAVGIHGTLSFHMLRRTREIGVRIALGAVPRDIVLLILRQAFPWLAVALPLGLAASLGLGWLLHSQLFGVTAMNPVLLGASVAVVSAAVLLACYIPARRATKVDPMVALRYE